MQNNFLEFGIRQNIKHAPSVLYGLENVQTNNFVETNSQDIIGGIFRDGSLGWIVLGAHIEIVSLKNGNKIADYTFGDRRFPNTLIAFATEVNIDQIATNLLAIGVQCSPTNSCIYLFAVDGSRIIHSIEIEEKLTSCCFIDTHICIDSALDSFDGCIIVGTERGKVIIVDLFVGSCVRVLNGSQFFNNEAKLCRIVPSTLPDQSIKAEQIASDRDGIGFGVQLEELRDSGSVLSILCLTPLLIVAVGFEDGKMLLYDLCTLDAFHIAHPPEEDSPLEKLTFIEPADDPRACVYVWSFHSNSTNAIAVMHSLTFEMKTLKKNGNGFIYKNFERCTTRLTMPIFEKYSKPISCQSITKFVIAEENYLTLCLLSWTSSSGAYVCVFDLNQWYKQQLPDTCDWRSSPTFLAIFPLGKQNVLDVWMNGVTVTPFSSLNRPEEHFYPSSLSFDCTLLTTSGSAKLHWLGLQNEALEHLNQSGPYAILEPNRCFTEMVRASLIPQFTDYSYDMNQSLKSKREFLLSIALEYNCINLLKKCALAWADGSHLSKHPLDGLSLSTLTDWIWNRAQSIKECCNEMCVPLFDHSGNSIEPRSQKVLLNFSRQLKRLFQLMDMIVTTCQRFIPGQDTLRSQRSSICMATEYQEVLQWLLNMGLLPEVNPNLSHKNYAEYRDSPFDEFHAIPYPYKTLKNYYTTQRRKFSEIDPSLIVAKTKSCRLLYIDAFIENECNSAVLRSEWRKGMGDGLYPPVSLQAMLRTLLVPDVAIERKYMLFVYLFMDLSTVLREERYSNAIKNLIKFPAVFKMDPGIIKITQAFWNLDHGEYELAIDEIISPLAQDQKMSIWQRELLIGALILNDVPHLALRALHAPGSPISPSLEIKTLLANDLVADAFQVQRMKRSRELLFEFYRGCHQQRKWHYLLNLSLNEKEEECLGEFLRSIESSLGENIHFLYLLRRCKYLEAITLIDDLHQKKRSRQLDLDTPNTILSTYRLTMTPSTRQFSDLYYSLKDDINAKLNRKAEYPKPLSSHLSQRQFDVLGGVYHQSLLHTEQTGQAYWENQQKKMCGLTPSKVPFLHGLQVDPALNDCFDDRVCYPEPFVPTQKRRLNESLEDIDDAPLAKRHRMDSMINSTLLTSFKDLPKQSKSSVSKESDDTIEIDDDIELLQTTLNTPVVQSHQKTAKKSYSLLERIGTPQSILKSRSSQRGKSISSIASRRSVDSDERSIRFNLPNDNNEISGASTPTVPDVFNFGITQRPSIHTETAPRTPSKLLLSHDLSEMKTQTSNVSEMNTSKSPSRKRLRSISSDDSSNITACIDVSVKQANDEPKSAPLSESSEDDSNLDSIHAEPEQIVSESVDWPVNFNWTTSKIDRVSVPDPEIFDVHSATNIPLEVPVEIIDQTNRSFGFTSMKNTFQTTAPAKSSNQPIERIIPIEIEDRSPTQTRSDSTPLSVNRQSQVENDKVSEWSIRGRDSINVSRMSIPTRKNLFNDTEVHDSSPSYIATSFDRSSLFRPRNLLSPDDSSEPISHGSKLSNVGVVVKVNKDLEPQTDIETVQIEDSEDGCVVVDVTQNVETKLQEERKSIDDVIVLESDDKTYKSSTPFTSRIVSKTSHTLPFDISNDSQLFKPRNLLSPDSSTLKEPSLYQLSRWEDDSIYAKRHILTKSRYTLQQSELGTTLNRSSLNPLHVTPKMLDAESSGKGNSRRQINLNEDGDEDHPIVIDDAELMLKTSNLTARNIHDIYGEDIYDLSSEALTDGEYDVDDYETDSDDSPDDVIDISSGSDEDSKDRAMISRIQKPLHKTVSLPPCDTLVKKAHLNPEINVSKDIRTKHLSVDITPSASEMKNKNPGSKSKCSEISFLSALDGSHVIEQAVASIVQNEREIVINEDVEMADLLTSGQSDRNNTAQQIVGDATLSIEVTGDNEQINLVKSVDQLGEDVISAKLTPEKEIQLNPVSGVEETNPNQFTVGGADITISQSSIRFIESETEQDPLESIGNEVNEEVEKVVFEESPLAFTDNEMNAEGSTPVQEHLTFIEDIGVSKAHDISVTLVSSDLNKALVDAENFDTTEDVLIESNIVEITSETLWNESDLPHSSNTLSSAVISDGQGISTLTDSKCDVTESLVQGKTATTSGDKEILESTEILPMETGAISATSDFNNAILQDDMSLQDSQISIPQTPHNKILMDTYDHIVTDSASINLNEAIYGANNTISQATPSETTDTYQAMETDHKVATEVAEVLETMTSAANVDDSSHQQTDDNDEIVLDIDEIIESATAPTVPKNDEKKLEDDIKSEKPSTSAEALKESEKATEIQVSLKKRLRSNSVDTQPLSPTPITTRKRSASFIPARNSPVLRSSMVKSESKSKLDIPGSSTDARRTREKSEGKSTVIDDAALNLPVERKTRAKSEAKSLESQSTSTLDNSGTSTDVRRIRGKSEAKSTVIDDAALNLPVERKTRAKSEAKTLESQSTSTLDNSGTSTDVRRIRRKSEAKSTVVDDSALNLPVERRTRAKSEAKTLESQSTSMLDNSGTSTDGRSKAKSEAKSTVIDDSVLNLPVERKTRAKFEVKIFESQSTSTLDNPGTSTDVRRTRAKSEAKSTVIDDSALNVPVERKTRAKSEAKTLESSEKVSKKVKRTNSRSKLDTPVDTENTIETEETSADNPRKIVTAKRPRTRSIAEDGDDAASGSSIKSTKSLPTFPISRGLRANILPVISEDSSKETQDEENYSDARRLTRGQKATMEKAALIAKMVAPPVVPRKRQRKNASVDPDAGDDVSDTSSVSSTKTSISAKSTRSRRSVDPSTPIRQSKRLLEKEGSVGNKSVASGDSDRESVVSMGKSTRSKRGKGSTSSKK